MAATFEVFDNAGTQVNTSTMVGLAGRSIFFNPASGNIEAITSNAMSGGGMADGIFTVGLDVNAFYDNMIEA